MAQRTVLRNNQPYQLSPPHCKESDGSLTSSYKEIHSLIPSFLPGALGGAEKPDQ